jgi:hypothetical protein
MHIKDLDLCTYHKRGAFDPDNWSVPLRAVGWLEHPKHFTTGVTSSEFLSKLKTLVEHMRLIHGACFMGMHQCSLCWAAGLPSPELVWSAQNIFIPGSGVVYVAPGGIVHYVEMHEYLPPSEFAKAVLSCPDPHSNEYFEALRVSNAGIKAPNLESEEDFLAKRERAARPPAGIQIIDFQRMRCPKCGHVFDARKVRKTE